MLTKKVMILLAVAILSLGVVSTGVAAQEGFAAQEEIQGLVTGIEADKVTVLSDIGQSVTVTVEDQRSLRNLKVGDRVVVRDGKLSKVPGG